jgi:hypothetical protein
MSGDAGGGRDRMSRFVDLPHLVQDRHYLLEEQSGNPPEILLATPISHFRARDDGSFGDGPSCERVVVRSIRGDGATAPDLAFRPQGIGRTVSRYGAAANFDLNDTPGLIEALQSDAFARVSVFGTVLKTLDFLESADALGRPVTWAFDDERLSVLLFEEPMAGERTCYDRATGSLRFVPYPSRRGQRLHTALSFDIVVHETAHAVLDGVAPDLYHATRTESLALHEAVADLAAILTTVLDEMVVFSLINISSSQLNLAEALGKLAEELGTEMRRDMGIDCLRSLRNDALLSPVFTDLADPYAVSEALSGAVFQTFVDCASGRPSPDRPADGTGIHDEKRVLNAARNVSRMVFRALDYLPPGDVSLADFARAVLAADRAAHRRRRVEAAVLERELIRRRIISSAEDVDPDPAVGRQLHDVDPQVLAADPAVAREFVERHRQLLRVPPDVEVDVPPCHTRIRVPARGQRVPPQRDLVLRVGWSAEAEVKRILAAGLLAGALVAERPRTAARSRRSSSSCRSGTMAPDVSFTGATRYGMLAEPVRLSQFHGQTVVIAFFFRARSPG